MAMKKRPDYIEFVAHIILDGNENSDIGIFKVPFKMKVEHGKNEMSLVYDDVFDRACDAASKKFPDDAFPKLKIVGISIIRKDKEYPVAEESTSKKDIDKLAKKCGCDRVLLLPSYTYYFTPEYEFYNKLVSMGMTEMEFDSTAIRKMMESVKSI